MSHALFSNSCMRWACIKSASCISCLRFRALWCLTASNASSSLLCFISASCAAFRCSRWVCAKSLIRSWVVSISAMVFERPWLTSLMELCTPSKLFGRVAETSCIRLSAVPVCFFSAYTCFTGNQALRIRVEKSGSYTHRIRVKRSLTKDMLTYTYAFILQELTWKSLDNLGALAFSSP